jgi:hypothetical protein
MFRYNKEKKNMQQIARKMPNKKKTNKNKGIWFLVTMAKKHIVIIVGSLEKARLAKKLMIIGLQ